MATKNVPVKMCDISKKPLKKGDEFKSFQVGDKVYPEVAGATIKKIEKFVASLDSTIEKPKKEKKEKDSGIPNPAA